MNNIQASRIINNFITDLKLNNDFLIKIQDILNNADITLNEIFNHNIMNEIYQYHYKQLISQYKDIKSYINDAKLKEKLFKKYSYIFAQQEIQNNMNTSIGESANNLSFTSQDINYRSAPIVVCREFINNYQSYKDHVFIGLQNQHHEQVISQHFDVLNNCSDINGTEFFTCLYLYDNDIIYISQREYNPYNINELIQILKNNLPNIKGIFYVDYSHNDNKTTIRLARKLI